MLKKGIDNIKDLFKGATRVKEIYLGDIKVYPGLINTTTGVQYSGWYYYLPNRSRTSTPYTEFAYQNNTTSRVFGNVQTHIETAQITHIDPGVWFYYSNNSYRKKMVSPMYTFSDNTVLYGEDIEIREDGVNITNVWTYNQHIRTKQIVYRYSDVDKNGPFLYEEGVISYEYYNWQYDNLPVYRRRNAVPLYTWSQYEPHEVRDGDMFEDKDYVTNYSTSWIYDYVNDKRTGITTYNFESGEQHQVSGVVQYPTNITLLDNEDYDNGACDNQTYEYVDYLQVRKVYSWPSTPTSTSTEWFNGPERRQKIDGMCGWVRSWSEWVNNGQLCGNTGALGYSCDGEYSVKYNRQVRYFQYPDGSGRTNIEYRAGSEHSRELVHGQCGYINPSARAEVQYFGFDENSPYDAYISGKTGSIWYDSFGGNYYDSFDGNTLALNGHYLIENTGNWSTSDYIYIDY
ncbi:MAG: hypothetical protein Q8S24_10810 [Eubacteriales bacterium]|nr:hypothetical protein [Eubacteriales bacterium]